MKCETPAFVSGSSREPAPIQKPSDTDRTLATRSVIRRSPESSSERTYSCTWIVSRSRGILRGSLDGSSGEPRARPVRDPKRWWALALLCSAYFMVILDVSIVNVALPSIQEDLHFAQGDLQWVLSAYALTFGGFLLLGGRTADLLGRRRVFMSGVALFTAASLLCGLSTSEGMLIGARAVQGLGAAILSPAALSIITTTFEEGCRAEQGARDLGRDGRQRRCRRRADGRRADQVARLGVDLLRQRADRRRRPRWSPGRSCARAASTPRSGTSTRSARP